MRNQIIKCAIIYSTLSVMCSNIIAQNLNAKTILDSLYATDRSKTYSDAKKLELFYSLKVLSEKNNLKYDSGYAIILFKIGIYEAVVNKNIGTTIKYLNDAIRINTTNKKTGSALIITKSYFNLGKYYLTLDILNKALIYFDSTILFAKTFPDTTNLISSSKLNKAYIYFLKGDYQKAVEESIDGMNYSLQKKDSSYFLAFLNQKAQSLYYENDLTNAFNNTNLIINAAERQNDLFELASALKTKALIYEKQQKFVAADSLLKKTISARVKTGYFEQVANDYIDYGNFFLDSLNDYTNAKQCYLQTIVYGKRLQDSILLARANTNIEEIYLKQKNYILSSKYCIKALSYLNIFIDDIFQNPNSDQLNAIGAKEMAVVIMNNKIKTLLGFFSKNKNSDALTGCLQTCLVMDTLVTKMRNEQTGTESKLYWRNYTRDFYANAIEASYLNKRFDLAFYFMEKSRAVLLNDKLNELDASSYLSKKDAVQQENYEIKIVELEQRLFAFADTSKQYQAIQLQLIATKNEFGQFINSLEQIYPAYYQYKYDDKVPSLQSLQQYLAKNNQSFVHYFLGDTVTYILAITPTNTKFLKLSQTDFNKQQLADFLQLCANKEALNNHYDSFAILSNSIYKKIFQPLQLPKGRIIICSDNIVIPFDALCIDKNGRDFLLNDYTFSYVYSARFLMKQFNNPTATGNFIGFAPVSYDSVLHVQSLINAADALQTSASYYTKDKLFTHANASRRNFFIYAPSYSIVSIFSHASADTTDKEPVLFMQDSLIHLSDLQLLNNPATKLILLSACQTNVGKAATGEGIYSLARGFATAGIPSVAATLWKADEQTIYAVSEKFNQYLSEGMTKDVALQKAKLYFIQHNTDNDKLLPFYWANIILIGNTEAIHFTASGNNYWWWIAIVCSIIFITTILLFRKKVKK